MSSLERIRSVNKIKINTLNDEVFKEYGKKIDCTFPKITDWIEENTIIPQDGNIYVASVNELENIEEYREFFLTYFAEMPWQIGYCNGPNSTLNGLEYHKGNEITIAVTDFVLLLGSIKNIKNNKYSVDDVKAFFVNKGDVFELYGTTLHFAPCKVSDSGFKSVIILPKGTNEPLQNKHTKIIEEDHLIFAKNKWLIAHPDRKPLIDKGAFPGIIGDNIKVLY